MKRLRAHGLQKGTWVGLGVVACGWIFLAHAYAHEPIFGLGPHTIFQGGVGIELEFEHERKTDPDERERVQALHLEILYGWTDNLAVTLAVPAFLGQTFEEAQLRQSSSGLGDVTVRVKYRFWRRDLPGIQDSAAVLFGIKFPTGSASVEPRLGSGSTDFLIGLAAARESRRWYYFGDVRFRYNTTGQGGRRAGSVLALDVAGGIRPWLTEYWQPDLVVLLEINFVQQWPSRVRGQSISGPLRRTVWLAPGVFFTYRNVAVKGGVQIPIWRRPGGMSAGPDLRVALAVELHL